MDAVQWACVLFLLVTVAVFAYMQGLNTGFQRGCEGTRKLLEEERQDSDIAELDRIAERLPGELEAAHDELVKRQKK